MTGIPGDSMKEERDAPKIEAVDAPEIQAAQEHGSEAASSPKAGTDGKGVPASGQGQIGDGLELDRMEVKPAVETGNEEEGEAGTFEPAVVEQKVSARPRFLVLLADHWIWLVAFLLGLLFVSALLWFALAYRGRPEAARSGRGVQVITASLGGEHYVRFKLLGPFRDSEGQEALRRWLPKIRDRLILSGGEPEVVSSIHNNDFKFLKKYILGIVSQVTGIPVEELDLEGLSVTRYSDEAEIGGEVAPGPDS
jgi:hypothetical protein